MSTPLQIMRVVAQDQALRLDELRMRKDPRCARARHVAMWLCRELLKLSYPVIGEAFGRDHTTVLQACRHVDDLMAQDPEMNLVVVQLKARLGAKPEEKKICNGCGQAIGQLRQVAFAEIRAELRAVEERINALQRAGA